MEKKKQSLSYLLQDSIMIYKDDLECILEILNTGDEEVLIENDNYKFGSLEDLESLNEEFITNIELIQPNPYINFSVSKRGVWIGTNDDDATSIGIAHQLRMYILSHRRKIVRLTENPFLAGMCLGTVFAMFYIGITNYNLLFVLSIIGLSGLWSWNALIPGVLVRIYPSINRKERFGIIYRKKDDIWLIIFSATFGAVIALIISKLFS